MEKEVHGIPRPNRLFIKTYLSFATVICVFAVLLGVLYMRLYEEATVENFEEQLAGDAENDAEAKQLYQMYYY